MVNHRLFISGGQPHEFTKSQLYFGDLNGDVVYHIMNDDFIKPQNKLKIDEKKVNEIKIYMNANLPLLSIEGPLIPKKVHFYRG